MFFEKFLVNNFALSDAEDKTSGLLNWGGIVDLPLLRTLKQFTKRPKRQVILLPYASLTDSRTLLQWLLACLYLNLDSKSLYYWYKRKKWLFWTAEAAEVTENHEDEWGLTWYLWSGIMHQFQTESTHTIY